METQRFQSLKHKKMFLYQYLDRMRFEVLTVVKMLVFWTVMPCGLVGGYKHFRGKYHPHHYSPHHQTKHSCMSHLKIYILVTKPGICMKVQSKPCTKHGGGVSFPTSSL
jgi:hypothetical protein